MAIIISAASIIRLTTAPPVHSCGNGSPFVNAREARTIIQERQHVLLLKDHVIAWPARLGGAFCESSEFRKVHKLDMC